MAVPGCPLGDHFIGGQVQGGKQCGGAVTDDVVGTSLDRAQTHRQQQLDAIKGLDIRFLINAEDNCLIERVELEPDDPSSLLDNDGIVRELERVLAVGLQRKGLQLALSRTFGDACSSRQGAWCPVPTAVSGFTLNNRLITLATLSSSKVGCAPSCDRHINPPGREPGNACATCPGFCPSCTSAWT